MVHFKPAESAGFFNGEMDGIGSVIQNELIFSKDSRDGPLNRNN
jgi:hypothetical protein